MVSYVDSESLQFDVDRLLISGSLNQEAMSDDPFVDWTITETIVIDSKENEKVSV